MAISSTKYAHILWLSNSTPRCLPIRNVFIKQIYVLWIPKDKNSKLVPITAQEFHGSTVCNKKLKKKTNVINRKDKWYIYTMEYHIAMKRNAFHETTWMNITYIIWSQRNQTQRSIHCEIPLIWNSNTDKINQWYYKSG